MAGHSAVQAESAGGGDEVLHVDTQVVKRVCVQLLRHEHVRLQNLPPQGLTFLNKATPILQGHTSLIMTLPVGIIFCSLAPMSF